MVMHGVDVIDPEILEIHHPFAALADTPDGWRSIFNTSIQNVRKFLQIHDGFAIIAKCTNQAMAVEAWRKENPRWFLEKHEPYELIEPADLEIMQALALMQTSPPKAVPASPGSMHRLLPEIPKCAFAFAHMQPIRYKENPERERIIRRLRLQTMRYRNIFVKEDCETVFRSILQQIDDLALKELGVKLSEIFSILIAVASMVEIRLNEYADKVRDGLQAKSESDALRSIDFFCSISPIASRAWSKCKKHCHAVEDFRWAAFQLSELCHTWPYMLDKASIRHLYGNDTIEFFEKLSIRPGELASADPEHFFMNNPVWRRPFVEVDELTLFLPLPNLFYGFPFQIFEQLIAGRPVLERAYSDARACFLEDAIETHIATAMPNAKTYQKVMWRDDESGILYENDVVALIGNTIFLFEAKSGKLDDVARRGGELSLLRNFKELFVEPAEQALRLERYLDKNGKDAKLWIKDTNEPLVLNLEKPKIVHKFSICIEHFAALTSARHNLRIFGAIGEEDAWAPVLSLGELMLIWRYLDTEVSFFHYLTRRSTLEEVVDFEGDEQDILSIYLTNGLSIDAEKAEGRQLQFVNIDGIVRTGKTPRADRTEFEILGIPLSQYWRSTLEEIYRDASLRHRFDILQVVLNQHPHVLAGIEQQLRKWKRGLMSKKRGDIIVVRNTIGRRVFVLAYHLTKHPMSEGEWAERARTIAHNAAAALFDASDCAVVLRIKKSKESTYDGVSFHRLAKR